MKLDSDASSDGCFLVINMRKGPRGFEPPRSTDRACLTSSGLPVEPQTGAGSCRRAVPGNRLTYCRVDNTPRPDATGSAGPRQRASWRCYLWQPSGQWARAAASFVGRSQPNCSHQRGKSSVGPVHSQSSTVPRAVSVHSVANSLNVSASERWETSVAASWDVPRAVRSQSLASVGISSRCP
jgi:hypothetical protein